MDDIQTAEKLHTSIVPEKYRPYGCTELTDRQIEFARKYLNETEENRSIYLQRLKNFISEELEAFSTLDDILLLAYLRARMFDFEQTCLLMRKAYEFLKTNRDYIKAMDVEAMDRFIEAKILSFSPYRTEKGSAVVLITAKNCDPDIMTVEEVVFGSFIAGQSTILNPLNQVSGYVTVIDCKDISFRQFREIMNWALFDLNALQHCFPFFTREIHVINTPSFFLLLWNLIKPFLSERSMKQVTVHDSLNWESLHEKIPPCILPVQVGGELESFSKDHWTIDIPLIKEKFFDLAHKIPDK